MRLVQDATSDPDADSSSRPPGAPSRARSWLIGGVIGFAITVAATAVAFSIIAMPLYMLASTEPGSGIDRSLIRRGLFGIAVPFGVVSGLVCGVLVGLWYARGGRLPRDRTPIHDL